MGRSDSGIRVVRAGPADLDATVDALGGALMRSVPGFAERLASYESLADRHVPSMPHYYLGVLGVTPADQGRGIGSALVRCFCELSAADPRSAGVYLETASPANPPLYRRAGFAETGQGSLGDATLWCMFHAHERRVP